MVVLCSITNIQDMRGLSDLSDTDLDFLFLERHGHSAGQVYISGYLQSIGLRIQRQRIRESLMRVDPDNRILHWGAIISRRVYYVPWTNSIWYLDGHHSLICWRMVVHGCIDGFSRKIMFLKCNSNNISETVLQLFLTAVEEHDGLWPSRIQVDKGVENVKVCDAMAAMRGSGRGSFIAGPSKDTKELKGCGGMCSVACAIVFTRYSLQWNNANSLILTI